MHETDSLAGWREPGAELIQDALARIGDRQHRRIFFSSLNNPRWVKALNDREVFEPPREPIIDESGAELWSPWPEGEYLVRMASLVPDIVGTILARVATSRSPYVREVVIQAAAQMPASHVESLVTPIEGYLRQGALAYEEEILSLVEKLADASMEKAANRIAQAAFRPRADEENESAPKARRRAVTGIDPHRYEGLLRRAVAVLQPLLGDKILTTVTGWLEEFQTVTGKFNAATGEEHSYIWRPAVEEHEQNHRYEEIGNSLVRVVRDRATADVRRGRTPTDVLETLERGRQPLLSRIGLHVLAETVATSPNARSVATARLVDTRFLDVQYRHEYAEMARAVLPLIDVVDVNAWEELVLAGPPLTREQIAERTRLQSDESLDDGIERYREVWTLNILSSVGAEILPARSAARLEALTQKYGELAHPSFPSYFTTSWVGPDSPISAEELSEKSVDEIRSILTTWEPDRAKTWGSSKEGLARSLQAVIASRAEEFSRAATDLLDLDPTYVRALFSGLTDALEADRAVDWGSIIEAIRIVARNPDDGSEVEGNFDEDVVWRFAQRQSASLIGRGSSSGKENAIPQELLRPAIEAIAPLASHADPTPEHEESYGDSHMDPLTLSLNATRPIALRAIAQAASRVRTLAEDGVGTDQASGTIARALQLLEDRLTSRRDESSAVAAAFGESLGRLIWIDHTWATENANVLLSDDSFGDIVFSTALATYRASRALIEFVTTAARVRLERVAQGGSVVAGWRTDRTPVELIGDHLVLLRTQGVIAVDDPLLIYFFDLAPVKARARVLGHLGWQIMQAEDVPADALERAQAIWEARATAVRLGQSTDEELSEFYWWASAEKFDSTWWLPYLLQAVASDDFDSRGMLGEVLESASTQDPGSVAEVLERLLEKRDEPFSRYDLVQHAPAIIAAALDSGIDSAIQTGRRVMDALGRGGHVRISDLVQQKRDAGD